MRIDIRVFKSHGFRLLDYTFRNGSTWSSGKAWVKDGFCFMFVTSDEDGRFDDRYTGCFVKPNNDRLYLYSLFNGLMDSNIELHNMVEEAKEFNEECEEECEEEPPEIAPFPKSTPVEEEPEALKEAFMKTAQRFSMRRVDCRTYSKNRIRLCIHMDTRDNYLVSIIYKKNMIAAIYENGILYWNDMAYDYVMAMREYLTK